MLLEIVAKMAVTTAKKAGNAASYFGMCQPKEPKEVKNKKNTK